MPVTLFSASSLQDYVICKRRFQLRYVLGWTWPAPETDRPAEQEEHIWLGRELHRLIHQHLLGIPVERLSPMVQHPTLERWWHAYLAFIPRMRPLWVLPEVTLSAPLAGQRLIARFDAIAITDQPEPSGARVIILDWKTYRHRPSREWLAARLQSRVYPVVFLQAGAALMTSGDPSDVELWYWFAEHPMDPERLRYSAAAYHTDVAYLENLVTEITQRIAAMKFMDLIQEVWPLTQDERECRYCTYRSLCRRGVVAASEEYVPDDAAFYDEAPYEVSWEAEGTQVEEVLF